MSADILIVDDEDDIRMLIADILSDEGYDCRTAGDSASAFEAIEKRRPNLLILDIWLEGSDADVLRSVADREGDPGDRLRERNRLRRDLLAVRPKS